MRPPVREALESSFDVDLSLVRVHSNPQAAESVGARAFAYGPHIFLGRNESPTNMALMGHEVAHVVQQQGAPVFQSYTTSGSDRFEREAESASAAAQRGEPAAVQGRTRGPKVQKQSLAELTVAALRDRALGLLEEHAPELVPILRQGVVEWLKERLGAAVQAMMDTLAGPVRSVGDLVAAVRRHFTNLVGWLREAGSKIARGDCSSISEAAEKIQQVFEGLAAPVVDRVKDYASKVKEFFQSLWDRFGAPVWDLLRRIGGAIWEQIQRIGRWIWEKTKPIRDWLDRAWTWFKNWLGIGEGEEGQNGVLQWFQRKAGEAWDWVSARLAPYKRQILIVVGILALLSPAGPIIAITAAAAGIMRGIQWLRQNMRTRGSVVQGRGILRGVILPAILGAIDSVSGVVRSIADAITGALTRVVNSLGEMAATVSSIPILSFAGGLVNFLADAFRGLLGWAVEGVQGLASWLQGGLQRLGGFARMVVDFLERVGAAVANLMRIGQALGGRVWNAIPACIRDPFIDFFIPLILRQISFFRELVSSPEAWQQTRAQVMELIRQVFQDFDLIGAMRSVFRLVVRALRIPVDLALQVLAKGAEAFDLVIAAPLRFIENSLKAVLKGVGLFMRNFLSHLWYGVQGWLLNAVEQSGTGVRPPASWDLRGLFAFVLSILGISLDHVLDLLAQRVGRPVVDRIRRAVSVLTGVWEWVKIAIEEGPAGLWRKVTDSLGNLGRMVLESAVGWVMTRIIAIVSARLTALAASAGLSGVLEAVVAVYQAITTAIEYARRILEVMLTVFTTIGQIARGVIDPAAQGVERGLRMVMPVVIGFLANYAGLGGIGGRIREIILEVRARVDAAILSLIDRALAVGRGLIDRLRAGVAAVVDWWRMRKQVRAGNRTVTIHFEGTGPQARLTISSSPGLLYTRYLEDIAPGMTTTTQRSAHAEALIIGAWIEDTIRSPERVAAAVSELESKFERLGALLQIMLGGDNPDGSREKPYWIKWHKARSANYPEVTINVPPGILRPHDSTPVSIIRNKEEVEQKVQGLAGEIASRRIWLAGLETLRGTTTQSDLLAAEDALRAATASRPAPSATGARASRHPLEVAYQTARRKLLDVQRTLDQIRSRIPAYEAGILRREQIILDLRLQILSDLQRDTVAETQTIGIQAQNRTWPQRVVGPRQHASAAGRGEQSRFVYFLRKANVTFSGGEYNADHVTDLAFGGLDTFGNLFPLKANNTPQQQINLDTGKQPGLSGADGGT
ncbi:MAG TPA: DUF4157 domain-containing protein, partial [Chloroflexia bacterium]